MSRSANNYQFFVFYYALGYRCYSDDCIRLDQLCDWRADCLDNSDEGHCNPHSDVHFDHFKWQIVSDSIFEVNNIGMIFLYIILGHYLTLKRPGD